VPPYPPYPYPSYYPYYPYAPPPPRSNRALIIVVVAVVVVLVVVPIAVAAILYMMVSDLIGGPGVPAGPSGGFSAPALQEGNVTFTVTSMSPAYPIGSFDFWMVVNGTAGARSPVGASGVPTAYAVSGTTYLVAWADLGGDGSLTAGDSFSVAGNGRPLPPRTDFTFELRYVPTSTLMVASWWT